MPTMTTAITVMNDGHDDDAWAGGRVEGAAARERRKRAWDRTDPPTSRSDSTGKGAARHILFTGLPIPINSPSAFVAGGLSCDCDSTASPVLLRWPQRVTFVLCK